MANEKTPAASTPEKQTAKVPARAFTPFEEVDRLMQRLSESFLPRGWLRRRCSDWPEWAEMPDLRVPSVDVMDKEAEVVVRAEVPGLDKKDIDVSVSENTVTIKGETRREKKEEKGEYYRREISEASFARTIPLPAEVDGSRAKATCADGMLELVIPKIKKSTRHSIKVD